MSRTLHELFPTRNIVDPVNIPMSHDGHIENYGDFATKSRRQINNLAVNGTDISALLHGHVAGVVGSSVNIQGSSTDNTINVAFERLLKIHSRMSNFSKKGRYGRNEAFRLAEAFRVQQGGVLIRYHYGDIQGAEIPFTIDLIGVDRIDVSKNNENTKNGLQTNTHGRITHIWLFDDDKNVSSRRFSMKNMHYYSKIWINLSQYTSVSRLVTTLSHINKTTNYFDSELGAAIERAKAGVYWSTELYSPIMDAFNKVMKTKSNNNAKVAIAEAKEAMEDLASRGVRAFGATPIPIDDKIHTIENNTSSVMDTFAQQSQKSIASSMGGSAVSVYKDIGVGNYASIKAAIAFDEEGYKIDFDLLRDNFIEDYLERLFMVGVQIGAIPVPREEYFKDRHAFHKWDILRVSKRSVDEKVTAQAIKMNAESGMTTQVREFAEKGLDFKEESKKQAMADADVAEMRADIFKKRGLVDPQLVGKQPQRKEDNE